MAGKLGFGAKFKRETAPASGTYAAIAGVMKVRPYNLKADDVDVSDHDSPSQFREFVSGMLEAGGIGLDLNYDPDNVTHEALEAQVGLLLNYQIAFRGTRKVTVSAYVNSVSPELPFDNKMTCTVALKISGIPVWS